MIDFEGLRENFQFLVIAVKNQVNKTLDYLNSPEPDLFEAIVRRDDHIDNLRNSIENKCFLRTFSSSSLSREQLNTLRAMHIIAVNLERIADFSVNIVKQLDYLLDYKYLYSYDYEEMFQEVFTGLGEVVTALESKDLSRTLAICRTENRLDQLYKAHFDRIMEELKTVSHSPGDHITVLFIVRYLERIGDSLLNIGEAILFAIIGEKIKINQFQALQETLSKSGFEGSFSDMDLQFFWGTRSGCRIGRLENREENRKKARNSVFKEGNLKKIRAERDNLERWRQIFPGLVPRAFSYHEERAENRASLLLELLPGCPLADALLSEDRETLENAKFILQESLTEIWRTTQESLPVHTDYIGQIRKRLPAIKEVHPRLERLEQRIGRSRLDSTTSLLARLADIEAELPAPFSVFIHGDMNVNNIVYDHSNQKIYFIDVHRSKYFDYVQDISVFLVSNFRMPVFEPRYRKRLSSLTLDMLSFARDFAEKSGDETFWARLGLAVARSLYTSTRFELNIGFAKEMFLRAHFLMDKMASHAGKPWQSFRFPLEVLVYP